MDDGTGKRDGLGGKEVPESETAWLEGGAGKRNGLNGRRCRKARQLGIEEGDGGGRVVEVGGRGRAQGRGGVTKTGGAGSGGEQSMDAPVSLAIGCFVFCHALLPNSPRAPAA